MEIDKVFSSDVDGVADNLFSAVKNSVSEIKAMQQRKAAENVQLVIQALKKIESDLQDKFDGVTTVIEKRVATIKDGRDGLDGRNGRDGKDGRPGRDGAPGARGPAGVPGTNGRDGEDGVSVTDARIDFDGSLIISLSSGREINVGEVVAPDLAEKIKVITNGGGTSQSVLDSLASLQAQITALQNLGAVNYVGTWNASTNSPTITSGSGDKGDYYVVSVAGSTNIDGQTLWGVGDWIIFNGAVWQKVDGGSTGDFTNLSASGTVTFTGLNASQAVFTNGSDQLVSNAITGTGNVVMSASPTLTGTANLAALTTSSTVTHNGGTANGVAYLNGSKVLTTGSALTFNGSTFKVTTSAGGISAFFTDATYSSLKIDHSDTSGLVKFLNGADAPMFGLAGDNQRFYINSAEQMRLTSTGLGIGTSSPDAKLDVTSAGSAAAYTVSAVIQDGTYPASGNPTLEFNGFIGGNGYRSGIGSIGGQQLAFYTPSTFGVAPTRHMTLTELGNLGIGTSSPSYKLHVAGTGGFANNGNENLFLVDTSGSNRSSLQISGATNYFNANIDSASHGQYVWRSSNAYTERMRLDASGNLGIGTSSPGAKLDVNGGTNSEMRLTTSGSGYLQVGQFTNGAFIGTSSTDPTAGILRLGTGGTTRATIDSSGNLGLGVTPSAWSGVGGVFEVKGNSYIYSTTGVMSLGANAYFNGTNWIYKTTQAVTRYEQVNGQHQWSYAASGTAGNAISFTQAMTLDASGNLGVGATSPTNTYSRNVQIDGSSSAGIRFTSTSYTAGFDVVLSAGDAYLLNRNNTSLIFSTNATERARITSNGDLLVGKNATGTANIGWEWYSTGGGRTSMSASANTTTTLEVYSTGASAYRFYVGMGGTIYATSTTITAISDQRLKENIQDIDVGLNAVMALKPRKFDWKSGKGKNKKGDRGWIAQEFEQVFPDMIDTWADPAPEGEEPYKAVNADLIPILVKAIQELKAEVDSLKAQLKGA